MYIVYEIQGTGDSVSTLTYDYKNKNEAESKYHSVLSDAAVSSVPIHTAILMTDKGTSLDKQYYEHPVEEAAE